VVIPLLNADFLPYTTDNSISPIQVVTPVCVLVDLLPITPPPLKNTRTTVARRNTRYGYRQTVDVSGLDIRYCV